LSQDCYTTSRVTARSAESGFNNTAGKSKESYKSGNQDQARSPYLENRTSSYKSGNN